MKFPKELKEEGDLHKDMMVSAKVRGVIKCLMCRKPRRFYSNANLTGAVKENVEYLVEEEEYVCGGCFVDDDSWLRHSVVVRRQLTYDSQIEVAYYSAKIGFNPICIHCGGHRVLLLQMTK